MENRLTTTTKNKLTGRFAPSPTGPLHAGSLIAAVGSWLFARSAGGSWLVRIEDLDPPRVFPGSEDEILASLEAYGLHWDGEIIRQSSRSAGYDEALARLREAGLLFDCGCSRADLQRASSAPSSRDAVDSGAVVYPGTCRSGLPPGRKARAVRFRVPDERIAFEDSIFGLVEEDIAKVTGDFVVKRADGLHAYQLAVVVDDIAQGVTQVVRGADLLRSTARQIVLTRALESEPPAYAHLPLLCDLTGEKLSKRNYPLPLPRLNEEEIARTLAMALAILGIEQVTPDKPANMLDEALARFDPSRIPKHSTTLIR